MEQDIRTVDVEYLDPLAYYISEYFAPASKDDMPLIYELGSDKQEKLWHLVCDYMNHDDDTRHNNYKEELYD